MSKIPGNSSQPPSVSQAETSAAESKKGKLGNKQVHSVDTRGYLDKRTRVSSGQALGNRQITPETLDMIALLVQKQHWEALSSAISIHGNTADDLTHILSSLRQNNIDIPADIQDQLCLNFSRLAALARAAILQHSLPTAPLEELAVLAAIAQYPDNHDSPIGMIARQQVDEFIKAHKLDSANREYIVQDMSGRIYSMITERMALLEDKIVATTGDAELKKQIQYCQNERRIEENYRREISASS